MITGKLAAGNYYTQSGFIVCHSDYNPMGSCTGTGAPAYFSQQNDGAAACAAPLCSTWTGGPVTVGNTSFFEEIYYQGSGFTGYPTCATFGCEVSVACVNAVIGANNPCFVDSVTKYSPVFGGTGYTAWPQPEGNQFFGEVNYVNTDVLGSADEGYTTFQRLQYQEINGSYNPPYNPVDDPTYGGTLYSQQADTRMGMDGLIYHGGSEGWAFDIFCANIPGKPNCS
jgi:hypothetical protein